MGESEVILYSNKQKAHVCVCWYLMLWPVPLDFGVSILGVLYLSPTLAMIRLQHVKGNVQMSMDIECPW